MKVCNRLNRICVVLAAWMLIGSAAAATPASPTAATARTAWFTDARFGMFIHMGLFTMYSRAGWLRSVEKLPPETDDAVFRVWNPKDFDARALAKLAKAAGMKYAVLTTKNHEAFCLWDSKLTDFKSANTPFKRDVVREFVDAFRAEGLKVGLYYSIIDWRHPDYPHYGDKHHPMRDDPAWKGRKHDWGNYLKFMHGQVRELVTGYGRIDLMWFDFGYDDMVNEKWRATDLMRMVRTAQPHILINNRLSGDGPNPGNLGDFQTPELTIPEARPVDAKGMPIVWETCMTSNNSWGYNRHDLAWKSPRQIIGALVNVVSKGGNLLVNFSPDAGGRLPKSEVQLLTDVGVWMQRNGESIYGCGPVSDPALAAKPEWGRFTQKGRTIYAHVMDPPIGHLLVKGVRDRLADVRILADGSLAEVSTDWWGHSPPDNGVWVNVEKPTHRTYPMPDPHDTVFAIDLK